MANGKEPKENISATIPITLLQIADYYGRENDLDRSQIITRALRLYLGTKRAKETSFWNAEYQRLQDEGKI